jgi:3-hydroxymyristoyl/3-hydroxydecanoyl-(acyl carrier protein) dehydratase
MPGVLQLEAMAQTGGVLAVMSLPPEDRKKIVLYFMSIDKAKFRKPVVPGDQVFFELTMLKKRGPIMSFAATAKVDGAVVSEAEMMAMVADK